MTRCPPIVQSQLQKQAVYIILDLKTVTADVFLRSLLSLSVTAAKTRAAFKINFQHDVQGIYGHRKSPCMQVCLYGTVMSIETTETLFFKIS